MAALGDASVARSRAIGALLRSPRAIPALPFRFPRRDRRTGSNDAPPALEESDNAREIEDRPAVRRMPPTRIANDREPNNSDISARRYATRLLL